MADNSDVILKVWNALPKAEEPEGWLSAPIVDGWFLEASPNEREVAVAGMVSGSGKFGNGSTIRSSALRAIDERQRFVITQNSIYKLGWPMKNASLQTDGEFLWPPALSVATSPDWWSAVSAALAFSGEHNLPDDVLESLRDSMHDDGDWTERRTDANTIGRLARIAGRQRVSEAWGVLAADLQQRRSRTDAAAFVTKAADQAARMYERDLTVEEKLAAKGWQLIAGMDDHQMSKLPGEGVKTDDPIRAAHRLALISEKISRLPGPVFVDPEHEDDGHGVVVLPEIGGADHLGTVRAFFAPIAGKKLPLTPVPDPAAILETLSAEFPHAGRQIAVVLADLPGRSSVQLRPTILLGKPGSGKSRLARRLGEALDLHIARYDGATASDSSFGGTARRWSTGEPSLPLAALLAARKADAMVIIDEIEKAGTSRHNGNFADALLGFLETETAKRYPDPFAQSNSGVDISKVTYIATANDVTTLPAMLRDRFRIVRIPEPGPDDLPALARFIVRDLAVESGLDERWFPPLDDGELYVAAGLWRGGSVRRLREIVARILAHRSAMRH